MYAKYRMAAGRRQGVLEELAAPPNPLAGSRLITLSAIASQRIGSRRLSRLGCPEVWG